MHATMTWTPLTDLIRADPSDLCAPSSDNLRPRLAKDEAYAYSVQRAWRDEIRAGARQNDRRSVGSALTYECLEGENVVQLHGYAVRLYREDDSRDTPVGGVQSQKPLLPGVLFFHTGAGPHDIFTRWKADSLVTDKDLLGKCGGCVVLISDILSDGIGWGWDDDRSRYNAVCSEVLAPSVDDGGVRHVLQGKIRAALAALRSVPGVDPNRIAALGWCLGGQSILELGRMAEQGVRALTSFHGVFPNVGRIIQRKKAEEGSDSRTDRLKRALICNGAEDPFVKPEELGAARSTFESGGFDTQVLQFDGVRHGFTNPAQDLNPNEAFSYDDDAAAKSWDAARSLLGISLAE